MRISGWDYLEEYELEREEILDTVDSVFRSGQLILGNHVAAFENEFATYCGTTYGIGVASGTDAIFLALKALGIGPGDEVITVANTAVPTVSAVVSTGATPRFVDIDMTTYLIDSDKIEKVINTNTRCILPVHLYGQCAEMDKIHRIADAHSLCVVEDCAQAHGATYNKQKAGSFGNASAFSFYPTKILGAYGDGGIVITNKEQLKNRLKRLRFYGMDNASSAQEHGYNSRLDEIHAAILRKKLTRLEKYISSRRTLAERYRDGLADSNIIQPYVSANCAHVYYLYVCRHPDRDRIIAELRKKDIHLNVSYPQPIHLMNGYRYLGYGDLDLPNTERAAREVFSLPIHPTLTVKDQDRVIEALHTAA